MRRGQVLRQPGFDGQYGQIRVFSNQELREATQGPTLVSIPDLEPSGGLSNEQGPRPAAPGHQPKPQALNPKQLAAVQAGPGPILVQAGPGTGKTRTLLGRVQHLLGQGVPAQEILILSFTRASAAELRQRLQDQDHRSDLPRAATLHALAYDYWTKQTQKGPQLLLEEDAQGLFLQGLDPKTAVQRGQAWQQFQLERESRQPRSKFQGAAQAYQRAKAERGLCDYTDLLQFWLQGLSAQTGSGWRHVLVDEIQDLTELQLALVQALTSQGGRGFFGIGDPNQSIYGFRGAVSQVATRLAQAWPDLKRLTLSRNYRSVPDVITAAAHLFPQGPRQIAQTDLPGQIYLCQTPNAWREALWVADKTQGLLGSTAHSQADSGAIGTTSPGEISILVRTRAQIQPLTQALDLVGVPYSVPEQEPFWRDQRVQALLETVRAHLGLPVQAPWTCPGPVLEQGPLAIANYFAEQGPVDPLFWQSRSFSGLKDCFAQQGGWPSLLNWLAQQDILDTVRRRVEKVRIMTLHASKGLEFTAVFIPGLEEGILPFAGPGKDKSVDDLTKQRLAEEKRLFYVGLTRAKQFLYLSHARHRQLYGRALDQSRSRFVQLLPAKILTSTTMRAKKIDKSKQLSLT